MIEELGGCVTCLSWAHTQQGCALKEPKSPGSGAASLRCKESEGTEVFGRAHHGMLHESNSAADFGGELLEGRARPDQTCSREDPWAAF